jgi:tricorn protease
MQRLYSVVSTFFLCIVYSNLSLVFSVFSFPSLTVILMKKLYFASFFFVLVALSVANQATAQQDEKSIKLQTYFSDPALSPDASEIAFVSGGDIWTVRATGGEARLLVSHPDYDSRPVYSPDGRYLAFSSTRSGNGDVYVLNIATGELRRLTFDDSADEVSAWSGDGKYIYFSSASRDIAAMRDIYRVARQGGTPMTVSNNRYVNEFFAMPSRDGKSLAFSARGVAAYQWWRHGHSHLDESEIWLLHEGRNAYEKITDRGAKHLWPMWSNDDKSIYFVSDKTGTENLYVQPLGGSAKQLTQFTNGRLLWPTMSNNGKGIVFERDFKVWYYDVATGKATMVNIDRRGVPASPGIEHVRMTSQLRDLALSPDNKKVAFTARGDVFVASAKDGGDAMRITSTTGMESQLTWSANSNTLVYSSDRDGASNLYQYNFITGVETRVTNGKQDDQAPKFSPDGKSLSFVRNGEELRIIDLSSKKETLVTKAYIGRPPFASAGSYMWSPDSKWIAFAGFGAKSFRNVYVVPASGGEGRPISFLANAFGDGITWSKDGKYILFNSGQRTENGVIARIDLDLQTPKFKEEQFRNLFSETVTPATAPANTSTTNTKATASADTLFKKKDNTSKAPINIVWEGIRQRLSLLPVGVDVSEHVLSPDGNTLVIIASAAGQENIFTYSLDELSKEPAVLKQVTSTASSKSFPQFSSDGKELFYMDQGRIQSVSLDSRTVKPLAVTAELDIDFAKEKLEVFNQAWDLQNKGFYDSKYHGADWNKIHDIYEPLAAGANTPDELRRILGLMVGELNASHSGVGGPAGQFTVGRVGLLFDTDEYEKNGRLKIAEVVALSPAALVGIKPGEYLIAIDGVNTSAETNVDELMQNKINKMVTLTIASSATDKQGRKVSVKPVNNPTEKGLLYKQWVQQRRDYVNKISNGRLGYVHMYDMTEQSLNQFYLDMDAENQMREGVVVDIRNNNGGFVNAYALDVLSRKGYMTMTVRGLPAAPARSQLGQRALDAPTILVTNQHSLSDAEDFSEGYRTLKLGKIVGEPTGGWIIYTSNVPLFDGTTVRLPFIKITDSQGKNMELAPRPVDIPASNALGEKDKDNQLDVAVKELLKQIGEKK